MAEFVIVILGLLGLVVAIIFICAPLMVYAIYTRLGETNELLRSLSTLRHPPSTAPVSESPSVPDMVALPPMFRSLS